MKVLPFILVFIAATALAAAVAYTASGSRQSPPDGDTSDALRAIMPTIRPQSKPGEIGKAGDPAQPMYSRSAYNVTPLKPDKIAELAKKLAPGEADVILKKGTEAAFCGTLLDNHKEGAYVCHLCGLPLFSSEHKFNSGTGWPSFFQPFDRDHIRYEKDNAYGMERVEIMCARCGAHLGHVFDDGPKPTGLRYCLNSVSLEFVDKGADGKLQFPEASRPVATATAYFAGGCFWGVEDHFQQIAGVIDAVSGYMGGKVDRPTYDKVCEHTTGHAETVKVVYDPGQVSYKELLKWFFKFHDPTQVDRQGPDVGDNYRSAIFAADAGQLEEAGQFIAEQQQTDKYKSRKIATQIQLAKDAGPFWEAEGYHQDYHERHGGSCALPTE